MDTRASKENGLMPRFAPPRRRPGGFTLIELLVVIAIIAILTAILLPVIFGAKEKARQGTVLDHFRQISDGLAKYKLDHHGYPPVLFGYASATPTPMSAARPGGGLAGPVGLYPTYINDPGVFTDPNNPVTMDKANVQSVDVNVMCPSGDSACTGYPPGTLVKASAQRAFYDADAFDISPMITSADALATPTVYIPRYQLSWSSYGLPGSGVTADPRQLSNPNPPSDTYVTCTTYHAGSGIGQGKVIVLFLSGNAEVMDVARFAPPGSGSDCATGNIDAASGVACGSFFHTKP